MNSVSQFLFGKKESTLPEKKIFIITAFVAFIFAILSEIWDISIGFSSIDNLLVGFFAIVYFLLYYFARFENKYNPAYGIVITLLALSILYFTTDGLAGSVPALYIFALASFIGITNHKYHKLVLLATITNLAILIVLENTLFKNAIIHYGSLESKDLDLGFSYFSSLIGSFLLLSYFKKSTTLKNIELQKQNRSKDLLFDIISHDLRSTISSILGLSESMRNNIKEFKVEEIQRFSDLINQESIKNFELLDSLLEWGKINTDRIQLTKETLNIVQIVNEVTQFSEETCRKKEVDLQVKIPDEIFVNSDKVTLKTILRNLLSNAIKFTPNKGKIILSTEEHNSKFIIVSVTDSGIGMDKQMIDNLFSPEINTNRNGTDGEESVGLGLIITKELIEKQGGNLAIESKENYGSTFKFTVPKDK